jgi:hypothetical protein
MAHVEVAAERCNRLIIEQCEQTLERESSWNPITFQFACNAVALLVTSAPRSQRAPHGHDLSKMIGVVVVDEEQGAEVALVTLPGRDQRV